MKNLSYEMKLNLQSLEIKVSIMSTGARYGQFANRLRRMPSQNEALLKCVSGWSRLSQTAKKNLQTAVVLHQKYPERMNKEAHKYLSFYAKVQDRLLQEKAGIESEILEVWRVTAHQNCIAHKFCRQSEL